MNDNFIVPAFIVKEKSKRRIYGTSFTKRTRTYILWLHYI